MKKTIEAEDLRDMNFAAPLEPLPAAIAPHASSYAIGTHSDQPELTVLDSILKTVKWVFLFLPGALAIHCCVMMSSLFVLSGNWPEGMLLELFAALMIYSFLVLLGLGRLSDLRYWKVIGAILSSSILLTVVYQIFSILTGYDYFGWGMLLTAPITIIFAQFMKARLDNGDSV